MPKSYLDLVAWQKAMDLVLAVYQATRMFPREELYGLTSQLRRAAVSVPSNIAEGQARQSRREFQHFLRNARGSLVEVETQLRIAISLQYLREESGAALLAQANEAGRVLNGLLTSLNIKAAQPENLCELTTDN